VSWHGRALSACSATTRKGDLAIPAGDFSLYDQMLDMAAALDPCRRASLRCG
jgi:hypothetical protein